MDFVVRELVGAPLFRFGGTLPREMRQDPGDSDEGHVIIIPHIHFAEEEWHQIVGTWQGINGGHAAGSFRLYIDGNMVGELAGITHRLDWQIDEWEIRIGLGFKGKIDDFFILERAMSSAEVVCFYESGLCFGRFSGLEGS